MKNQEDIKFIQSMQTGRVASFGVHDQSLTSQIKRKESRTVKQREAASETVQLADSPDEDANTEELAIPGSLREKHIIE